MMQVDPLSLLKLIEQHLTWYPLMEPRDVYKLLYQGVMGSEHLIASPDEYRNTLEEEFAGLQADPNEILLEPIRTDGLLYRINLRPYKSHSETLEGLIPALLASAREVTGSREELKATWEAFTLLCRGEKITIYQPHMIEEFSHWLEQLGYPAVHHSLAYNLAYRPAYRLISARQAREMGLVKEDE